MVLRCCSGAERDIWVGRLLDQWQWQGAADDGAASGAEGDEAGWWGAGSSEGGAQTVDGGGTSGGGSEEGNLLREGYLYKERGSARGVWDRRYCRLRPHQLLYASKKVLCSTGAMEAW